MTFLKSKDTDKSQNVPSNLKYLTNSKDCRTLKSVNEFSLSLVALNRRNCCVFKASETSDCKIAGDVIREELTTSGAIPDQDEDDLNLDSNVHMTTNLKRAREHSGRIVPNQWEKTGHDTTTLSWPFFECKFNVYFRGNLFNLAARICIVYAYFVPFVFKNLLTIIK